MYDFYRISFQSRSSSAISTRESSVSALKHCWEILKCDQSTFVTLVTGAFPPAKVEYRFSGLNHSFFLISSYETCNSGFLTLVFKPVPLRVYIQH